MEAPSRRQLASFVNRCLPLEKFDSLESLKLSLSSPTEAFPTLRAIASSSHLKEAWLSLEGGQDWAGLLCKEAILGNASLEKLTLDLKECSETGLQQVVQVLRDKQNICDLSLLLNNVGQAGSIHLAQLIGPTSSLREFSLYATQLDLHDKCIGDEGVATLSHTLEHNPLRSLCIAQNGVTKKGVEHILHALGTGTSQITALDLRSNHIDGQGAEALAQHLQSYSCALEKLVLNGNSAIGNNGARTMALALGVNTSLKTLSLRSCGIGGEGASRFASALAQNQSLKELDFRGNTEIGDDAVEMLSQGLKSNAALLHLDLSSCSVGDQGCACLADALHQNCTLLSLHLHRNSISDGGIVALGKMLSKKL